MEPFCSFSLPNPDLSVLVWGGTLQTPQQKERAVLSSEKQLLLKRDRTESFCLKSNSTEVMFL